MTIVQMQYFKAVCQYGSISKAAETIHVSQPTISVSIKDLESELGILLFNRENKHMTLTHEGTFFYDRISILLNEFDALSLQMTSMAGVSGRVSLCVPVFTSSHLFSHLIDDFSKVDPDIRFEAKQCSFNAAIKMMESGACDLAIVVDNGKIPDKYECVPVLSTEFLYCVSSEHPLAHKTKVCLADLCNEPLILNEDESYMTTQVKKRFYDLGLVPNILLYAVQLSLIKEMLYSGKAGTFLIKEVLSAQPGIIGIPLDRPIYLNFVLIWKKGCYMSRGMRSFTQFARDRQPVEKNEQ